MSLVKYVNESHLRDKPFGKTICGDDVPVIPLADLTDGVHGTWTGLIEINRLINDLVAINTELDEAETERIEWVKRAERAEARAEEIRGANEVLVERLAAMTRERDEAIITLTQQTDEAERQRNTAIAKLESVRTALAASQARCREMEEEKRVSDFMRKRAFEELQKQVAVSTQLQATLEQQEQDAQRYRYLRARAALDQSDKQRITWHIPMWDIPRCYQDIPIKDQLDKDLDEAIRRA